MNIVAQVLTFLGFLAAALFASGLRPVFLIPAYGLLALGAIAGWSPKRHADLSSRVVPCLASAGVFFGYILVRTVVSPVEYIARPDEFMVLGALIVYLVTALCATSPTARVVFVCGFFLLAGAQTLVGAIQFSRGDNFMAFDFLPRADYGKRASGFYGCPNHLAGFLEMMMLMALSFTFWSRWRMLAKIAAGYVALVCGVGLALTGSRGGYASAAIGLFVFAAISLALARNWMWREIWLFLVTVLCFAAIGGAFLVFAGLHSSEFLSQRLDGASHEAPLRLAFTKAALHQFQVNPMFGTGSGSYLYYGRFFREPGVQGDPTYAHNDYAQLLGEFGLIAALGLAVFLFFHIRNGWSFLADVVARRTIEGERDAAGFHGDNSLALVTGALSAIAALLAHSIGDFNLHIPPNTLLVAFLFGTLANPFSVLVPEAKRATGATLLFLKRAPLALPALGVLLGVAALPKWRAEYFADKAKVQLSDATLLLQEEGANAARAFSQKSLDRDPKNTEMYLALGDSEMALAELADDAARSEPIYEKAIAAYEQGSHIAPMDVRFLTAIATAYDEMKRFAEAEPFYQRARVLDQFSYDVLWPYANHLYLQGKLDDAEAIFRSLVLNEHPAAYHSLELIKEQRAVRPVPESH